MAKKKRNLINNSHKVALSYKSMLKDAKKVILSITSDTKYIYL
jgi:hypothetical protein